METPLRSRINLQRFAQLFTSGGMSASASAPNSAGFNEPLQETLAPSPIPGRPPTIAPAQHAAVRLQVSDHSDATLAEHCDRWAATSSIRVSVATMSRTLTALELSRKRTVITAERYEIARTQWRTEVERLAPRNLVFLDETNTPTTLTPRYGRAPRGERELGRVPKGRWYTVTMLATITPDGMRPTMVIEGAVDREAFDAFVAQQLITRLRFR